MNKKYKLIDTHAHLNFKDFKDSLDKILEEADDVGVEKIIIPGVTLHDTPEIIEIIEKYNNIYGAVAIHPSEAKSWDDKSYDILKNYALHPKIIAVGETGLDYYWDKTFIDTQKLVFREHIKLAAELNLPLIIHNREAHGDIFEILKEFPQVRGVMHCFSGSAEFALECLKLGYYISLGGPVTFKNAKKPREVVEKIPLGKLLVETDSPFLAPHPFRGKTNDPSKIVLVVEEIARIKGVSFEEAANQTSKNAESLFKI